MSFNGNFMTANKEAGKVFQQIFRPEPVLTGTLNAFNSENLFSPKKQDKLSEMKYIKASLELNQGTTEIQKKLDGDGVATEPLVGSESLQEKLEKINIEEIIDISDDEEDSDVFRNKFEPFSGQDWRYNISTFSQVMKSDTLQENESKYAVFQKKVEHVSNYLNYAYVRKINKKK